MLTMFTDVSCVHLLEQMSPITKWTIIGFSWLNVRMHDRQLCLWFVTRCHWTEKSFSSTNHRTRVLLLLSPFERKKPISSAFFNRSQTSQGIWCIRTRIRTIDQQRHWKVACPVSDLWFVDRVLCDRMDLLDVMIFGIIGLGCWADSCSTSDQSLRQFGLSSSILRRRAKRSDASVSETTVLRKCALHARWPLDYFNHSFLDVRLPTK